MIWLVITSAISSWLELKSIEKSPVALHWNTVQFPVTPGKKTGSLKAHNLHVLFCF